MQKIFKVINMAGPHAFTDDHFSLEKSGWIKKTAVSGSKSKIGQLICTGLKLCDTLEPPTWVSL